LKALELAKKMQWDFYANSSLVYELTADEMKVRVLTCNDMSTCCKLINVHKRFN
jgi:hypothetical protein